MLLRSKEYKLWHAKSADDGISWHAPEPTEFTNNKSKFHFGRLPDGRYYCVGNPNLTGTKRCPLVLSLSYDGVRFCSHFIIADEVFSQKVPGKNKSGVYGYPHTLVHNGSLHIICSICKEDIIVYVIDLDLCFFL